MWITEDPQLQWADLPFGEMAFDPNHPLLRLSAAIRWEELFDQLKGYYQEEQGRKSIPLRAQAGTLMIKFLKHLSDRETVLCVKENLYAQRFCGLTPTQAVDYMCPATGLSNFRAKIGPPGMALIHEALTRAAEGEFTQKRSRMIVDTTCVPLDILYPTDIRLLERCRREILRLMKEAKGQGLQCLYRTYSRTARKVYVQFSRLSKPKEKTRKRVHKQLFQFVRRNFKQLLDLRTSATRSLGLKLRFDTNREEHRARSFLKKLKEAEHKVRVILHQQGQVRRGRLHIPHRIVSFHKDQVRPIVRGKFPLHTEFGPKVLLAMVRKCVYVIHAFQDNVADANLLTPALRWFKMHFGHLPRKPLADRGFWTRWRVMYLEAVMGLRPGIQRRGKTLAGAPSERRMIRQRLPIEARISLAKRKFGWGKCRARREAHELSWISLGAAAMNAHVAFFARPP